MTERQKVAQLRRRLSDEPGVLLRTLAVGHGGTGHRGDPDLIGSVAAVAGCGHHDTVSLAIEAKNTRKDGSRTPIEEHQTEALHRLEADGWVVAVIQFPQRGLGVAVARCLELVRRVRLAISARPLCTSCASDLMGARIARWTARLLEHQHEDDAQRRLRMPARRSRCGGT